MLLQSLFIFLAITSRSKADGNAPYPAPTECVAQNSKSASDWESCVAPATAFSSCNSDNQPCACSAFTLERKCYSKYCPGEYPNTSVLEGLCLHPPVFTTDPFNNTSFHRNATAAGSASNTRAATATTTSSTHESSGLTSRSTGSTGSSNTATGATVSVTQSKSLTSPSSSANAAAHAVIMPVGGLLAAVLAGLF